MATKGNTLVAEGPDGLYIHEQLENKIIKRRLTNFTAHVLCEKSIIEHGHVVDTIFKVGINDKTGKYVGETSVTAREFLGMEWVFSKFGSTAEIIDTSKISREKIGKYILDGWASGNKITAYRNPGYADIGGVKVFVHECGVLGGKHLSGKHQGEFEPKLRGIGFRNIKQTASTRDENNISLLELVNILPSRPYGMALLSYIARSALTVIEGMPYAPLFIVGESGSYKSSVAQVVQSCYGASRLHERYFLTWESSFASMAKTINQMNGGLIVIDDFVCQKNKSKMTEFNEKAELVIRGNANQLLRETIVSSNTVIPPIVIITGEHVPNHVADSLLARTVFVESEGVQLNFVKRMHELAEAGFFEQAMKGFIQYVIKNEAKIASRWKESKDGLCAHVSRKAKGKLHTRTPMQYAGLMFSFREYTRYLKKIGVLDKGRRKALIKNNADYIVSLAEMQNAIIAGVTTSGIIKRRLKSMVQNQEIHIADNKTQYFNNINHDPDAQGNNKFIGYCDRDIGCVMLQSNISPSEIFGASWLKKSNLPTSKSKFYKHLDAEGILMVDASSRKEGRLTTRGRAVGSERKVNFYSLSMAL